MGLYIGKAFCLRRNSVEFAQIAHVAVNLVKFCVGMDGFDVVIIEFG